MHLADEGPKALGSIEVVVVLKGVLHIRQRLQNVRMLWPRNRLAQELVCISNVQALQTVKFNHMNFAETQEMV